MKRFLALLLCIVLCTQPVYATDTEKSTEERTDGAIVSAPSVLLM